MRKHKANRDSKVKPSHIQQTMKSEWCREINKYFGRVKKAESEQAKSECFLLLLNDLFGMQPGFIEGYIAGIEKVVKKKKKDRICIGRIDELFGNLIIEFERDFVKNRVDAEEQLRKYVAYLWSQESPEKRTPYLCITLRYVWSKLENSSRADESQDDQDDDAVLSPLLPALAGGCGVARA